MLFAGIVLTMMVATGCNKEDIKPNVQSESSIKVFDNGVIDYGTNLRVDGDVIDWGDTISTTEATTIEARWITVFDDDLYSSDLLSVSNYNDIIDDDDVKCVIIAHLDSCGFMAMAGDENDEPIMSMPVYKLDANGGRELDSAEINDYLEAFIDFNDEDVFPVTTTYGLNLLNDIAEQDGAENLLFTNALDEDGEDDYLDMTVKALDDEDEKFGITGANGAKDGCRKWVPTMCCAPGVVYGHWINCTWAETCVWIVLH